MSEAEKKLSSQEDMKLRSKYLKGNVAREMDDLSKEDVSDETYELLKFHGSYFGYDRDTATERKKQGLDKKYEFMVRTRIPAGRLTAEQYLKMDELSDKYANGTLRITTRQVFQFHVILKKDMKSHIAEINKALLSTQSGCGDVVRNVTTSPAPINDIKHKKLRDDSLKVAEFVRPKTSSYREIWLDEKADEVREREVTGEEYEPLYGATYMPRKFKIGLITPEDNSIDVFTHDLGIILIYEGDKLKGYNIVLGGGMGMKHEAAKEWKDKKTYPRLATPIAFVGEDDLLAAVEAAVKLQRDFGDRTDRQHARLKYLIDDRGVIWTRKTFEEFFKKAGGKSISDPVQVEKYHIPSHMGWHDQKDGKLYLGVPVPSGRIVDYDKPHKSGYTAGESKEFAKARYKTGLRAIIEEYKMNLVLTPTEEIILSDIKSEDKAEIEKKLRSYGIPLAEDHTPMQLHYMTCVALPTCAKALAESERVQFHISDAIQAAMDKNGIGKEKISVRVTGCPNGCARPYVGDIGIVGRMPGHYVLFIGGDFEGTRLNSKVFDKVPLDDIVKALDPMFAIYAVEKQEGEGFGDFCHRCGVEEIANKIRGQLSEYKWAAAS